jgi:hypothetical protein
MKLGLSSLGAFLGGVPGLLLGYQAQTQADAAQSEKQAQAQALQQATKTADLADQAMNKANARTPDLGALLAGNSKKDGASGTLLTGSQGVDPSTLLLGKNTLLGG